MIVKITTYLESLDLLWVVCYTIDNPRGERTADSDSYSPRIEKKLDKLPKVCYNSKCKEEIPKRIPPDR